MLPDLGFSFFFFFLVWGFEFAATEFWVLLLDLGALCLFFGILVLILTGLNTASGFWVLTLLVALAVSESKARWLSALCQTDHCLGHNTHNTQV